MNCQRRFVLIGGFLGAGKTTSIAALSREAAARGLSCVLITNDQGEGLIDTAMASASPHSSSTKEITGGCFCCRADELIDSVRSLDDEIHPDLFFAEPVGSCTDLVATVLLPLRELYDKPLDIAVMSVVVDADRLWKQHFGRSRGQGFHKDVCYIFDKQLEEAELIVINKVDRLTATKKKRLLARMETAYPAARTIAVSAQTGEGVVDWFEAITINQTAPSAIIPIDYERYGRGEAMLGWFNGRLRLSARNVEVDPNEMVENLVRTIQSYLVSEDVEIAHLKASIECENSLAVANATASATAGALSVRMDRPLQDGELLINVRAEADPGVLEAAVLSAISDLDSDAATTWLDSSAFAPGQPSPTYRTKSADQAHNLAT